MADNLNPEYVFKTLSTLSHRIILKELASGPKTVMDLFASLKREKNLDIKNRESVYKALEKLRKAKLVKKYYDENRKKMFYKLSFKKISFDMTTGGLFIA